jgi:hypothetical protein
VGFSSVFPRERRCGFACAPAYSSEVVAFGNSFIPGTEVPGFYLEARSASFCVLGILLFHRVYGQQLNYPTQAKRWLELMG